MNQAVRFLVNFLKKTAIIYAVVLVTLYLVFRAYYINFAPGLVAFSLLLYLAELHTIILMFGFLYSIWPRKYREYLAPSDDKNLQINMFVTVCGEPIEVVKETITHARQAALHYQRIVKPHNQPRVVVLNDGKAAKKDNWQAVEDLCRQLDVDHIARDTNEGFKAGNINNGLQQFPADNPHQTIDCFLDADFCAKQEFLLEILKPLTDDKVDFVQSPQRYKNLNTWVAKAAGAHQIFFFDYICPAKAHDNALFLCGTNYAIRRSALLAAGGVDNRFVTEDYATSIKLHLLGKRGVYLPKVLALGMAPMNLKEYFNQQTRWCKGCLDANGKYLKDLLFGPLSWRQKWHYFLSTVYYFIGVRDLILVLAPIPYLFWGISLIRANTWEYLAFIYLPLIVFNFSLYFATFHFPIKSLVLDVVSFPVFAVAWLSSVIGRNLPFTITIKKYERENPLKVYKIQLLVALTLIGGLIYSLLSESHANATGRAINYFWASYDASFLMIGFYFVIKENYQFSLLPQTIRRYWPQITFQLELPRWQWATLVATGGMAMLGWFVLANYYQHPQPILAYVDQVTPLDIFYPRQQLLVPAQGAYYGYYLPQLNGFPDQPQVNINPGEQPSLVMFYQDWGTESEFNTRFAQSLASQGVIPVITWEPWDANDDQSRADSYRNYHPELVTAGQYDAYIRSWAKSAAKYKQPLFLRFAHEMNGNWYPWGTLNNQSAADYVAMWRHVHDIFVEEGADNVLWVWSPNNTDSYGRTDNLLAFYPGDEYVDWVGFSGFNWGTTNQRTSWRSFRQLSWAAYEQLVKLNKPMIVAETSSVSHGGDKAAWFRQTLTYDLPAMPQIKAVIFFNDDFGTADFSLQTGMPTYEVIYRHLTTNDYYLKAPLLVSR